MEARNLITASYFGMIKNLSRNVKLELISLISESMQEKTEAKKNDSWKELFGAFNSNQSAEEIIEDLKKSRFTSRKIIDL